MEVTDLKRVTLIRGDGIGPEIAQATRRCVDATGAAIEWDIAEAGIDVMETEGTPLPEKTVKSIEANGIAIGNIQRKIFVIPNRRPNG